MMNFSSKTLRRAALRALLVVPIFVAGESCTNLTEVPHDALTPANAFRTEPEILAGIAGVYANLRAIEWVGYITVNELTTEAMIVPTRGNDWYDNGQWLDLHRQTWTANSAGTLAFINGAWNDLFSGVAKANLMIDVVTKAGGPKADSTLAELRTMRVWYYYMLQDMFGGVPLVTTTELKQYPRSTRKEVFDFMESELLDARAKLPDKWDAANYGRLTKGAANAILASIYLNAGVFSKDAGVNANGYNSCAGVTTKGGDACQAAIDAADAVINSGQYQLAGASNWKANFSATNKNSPENIFVIVHTAEGTQGLGGSWPMRTLHYNQLNTGWGSPWNGFATLAETYQKFDNGDERKGMWLEGQAYSFETGLAAKDRNGNALIFTDTIKNANAASEGEGIRFNKFPPVPDASTGNSFANDFPFFRLSEMYLIKAEALNEQGKTAQAIVELARIHNLRDPGNPISAALTQSQVRDAILKERVLELTAEGKHRTDMIRYGQFLKAGYTSTANGRTDKTAETYRILFPIPSLQIQSNPLLVQNPGY